jgi:hypothetical protein
LFTYATKGVAKWLPAARRDIIVSINCLQDRLCRSAAKGTPGWFEKVSQLHAVICHDFQEQLPHPRIAILNRSHKIVLGMPVLSVLNIYILSSAKLIMCQGCTFAAAKYEMGRALVIGTVHSLYTLFLQIERADSPILPSRIQSMAPRVPKRLDSCGAARDHTSFTSELIFLLHF